MNNHRVFICLTVVLWAALVFLAIYAKPRVYENLLLITPKPGYTPHVRLDALEELNETGAQADNERHSMITWEVNQEQTVQAGNNRYYVILKGTSYTYPFVMRTTVLSGGFFTEEAEGQKSKVAVLNEKAAFEIFGGAACVGNEIRMNNNVFNVVGVINDGDDENNNMYVPTVHLHQLPGTLLARMTGGEPAYAAHVENECKQAGISSMSYDFINMDTISHVIQERAAAALGLCVCVVLIVVSRWGVRRCIRARSVMPGAVAVGAAGAFVWTGARCAEIFIRWSVYTQPKDFYVDGFQEKIRFLQSIEVYSVVLFIGFCVMLGITFIASLRPR